ncbi:unnamed protein product [Rotaria magnacalcarata]
MRHEHFAKCAQFLARASIIYKNDTVVQMAQSSFDVHFGDIAGTLIVGASFWNWCGQSEMNLGATYHLMDLLSDTVRIPIGRPLPNYERLVLDEFLQLVFFGQEGELAIRGIGVFLGHLHREDLTAKALIDIDEKMF